MSYDGCRIALQAPNGQYLCAEGGGGHEVVANRDEVGPWETFEMQPAEHRQSTAIWDTEPSWTGAVFLRAANGQYLCADDYCTRESRLVANRDQPRKWETFFLLIDGVGLRSWWNDAWEWDRDAYMQGKTPFIHDGAAVALHTFSQQGIFHAGGGMEVIAYFVCAERGGGHEVMVNRPFHADPKTDGRWDFGPWETFNLRVLTPQSDLYGPRPRETEPFPANPPDHPRGGGASGGG